MYIDQPGYHDISWPQWPFAILIANEALVNS